MRSFHLLAHCDCPRRVLPRLASAVVMTKSPGSARSRALFKNQEVDSNNVVLIVTMCFPVHVESAALADVSEMRDRARYCRRTVSARHRRGFVEATGTRPRIPRYPRCPRRHRRGFVEASLDSPPSAANDMSAASSPRWRNKSHAVHMRQSCPRRHRRASLKQFFAIEQDVHRRSVRGVTAAASLKRRREPDAALYRSVCPRG